MNNFATLLLVPVFAVVAGLLIYWFTDWLDRREAQRHHPAE
jgi:hypothetical protein